MSKNSIQISGGVMDGKFLPLSTYDWNTALKIYEGQEVTVTIGARKKIRSIPQNRYLFGGPYKVIAEATGQDVESIHAFFKDKFLKEYDKGPIPTILSTSKLDTKKFIWYYRQIIQFAAEFLGIFIAEPNEKEMWGSLVEQIEKENRRVRTTK